MLCIRESNADLFFNLLVNWVLSEYLEFSLYSQEEFCNSQQVKPQVTQIQVTPCDQMNRTQCAFYDRLFGQAKKDFNIKNLITSKNILDSSSVVPLPSEQTPGPQRHLYQVTLAGVFFREQLQVTPPV